MSDNKRKKIALLTGIPEDVHGNAVIEGIRRQCEQYDYDLYIFAAMIHTESSMREYVIGEANIFNLVNYEEMDGVILDSVNLFYGLEGAILGRVRERLSRYPELPVVALELPVDGIPTIRNRNENILREMCRHMVLEHNRRKVALLTGYKGNEVAESRVKIFRDELERLGVEVPEEWISYGDFWYPGGRAFAEQIIKGEIERPDAVIAASDCMAIGLMEKLLENGIRVPEDIAVMGFDGIFEGRFTSPTLSSFSANDAEMAADAVNELRKKMDPGMPVIPYEVDFSRMFFRGNSCGCVTDVNDMTKQINDVICLNSHNEVTKKSVENIRIGQLLETYVMERFTAAESVAECFRMIFEAVYLLNPYQNFCLCLNDGWMDTDARMTYGYSEQMRTVVAHSMVSDNWFFRQEQSYTFSAEDMMPSIYRSGEDPEIYIFVPVHFNEKSLGYVMLQRSIHKECHMTMVFRNWVRYVNNALEMIRDRERLKMLSLSDGFTGFLNRRGMSENLERMISEQEEGECMFFSVIDMDGLKKINDTYGHTEGDNAIRMIANAIRETVGPGEIVVRAGGDEFYLIGMGSYTEEYETHFTDVLQERLSRIWDASGKMYDVKASIGCVTGKVWNITDVERLLRMADARMYAMKTMHKEKKADS